MQESKLNSVLENLEKETKVIFYRSSGPGGQRKNKKETAVKLYHIPTGIKALATEFRSQAENKKQAFRRLKKRLSEFYKKRTPRIPTRLPKALKEETLKQKRIRSEKKKFRKKVDITEEF